ncbi:MAG: aminoglycoside phosphotransferase family protein [Caldilineaceae bacterium SB0668_bin_21]|nr:aminoglycoside phosphotransferase family protein [Caldilineaceae bacterium SB0668_bin_21]MYC20784.1 aminoglycoside phosphotransferase family protein [Caldilineaceae bacterium SB0662_bin_25]
MKNDNSGLRQLVNHLSQRLQEENVQRCVGGSERPDAPGLSASQRSAPSARNSSLQTRGAWQWQDWEIHPICGGMNGRVFRASGLEGDVAVKFTVRDRRDRAGREWAALTLLAENSDTLAPRPLLLDRDRYPQPVIVQSWLDGDSSDSPPADDAAWESLCRHLLEIHSLPKGPGRPDIRPVVLYVTSASDALRAISYQLSCLPPTGWPRPVNDLVDQALSIPWPRWPRPPLHLCRGDPNIRNFIRRPLSWASVDWEYSGWGDPAFEIADFLVHAAHFEWPHRQARQLVDLYRARSNDTAIRQRIAVYETLMLIWWTLRLGRLLPEARSGADKRLAARPQSWYEERLVLQQRYLQLAAAALNDLQTVL